MYVSISIPSTYMSAKCSRPRRYSCDEDERMLMGGRTTVGEGSWLQKMGMLPRTCRKDE